MNNKIYDLVYLGHYTNDTIVSSAGTRYVDGGGFNYGSHVAVRLGFDVAAVTRLAEEDIHTVKELEKAGVDVYYTLTPKSTCVTLEYPSDNPDERIIHFKSSAGPFTPEEVEGIKAKAFVISPSIRGEVPIEVVKKIKEKGAKISLDVQGYIRVVEDGVLVHREWPEVAEYLSLVNVLKTDAVEAASLTGESNKKKAAKILVEYGPKEIIITHRDGILVYDGNKYHEEKFYPKELVGRSGRGDTVVATYMANRLDKSPAESLIWAAAAVSLKMEAEGPFKRSLSDVEELIEKKYR